MKRLVGILALVLATGIWAEGQSVPNLINYQGKIAQPDGNPIADGTYGITFRIYDASEEGTLVWGRTYQVAVATGQFNVILGAPGGTMLPAAVNDIEYAFADGERYLGITVETDASGNPLASPREMAPRQQILSAPFTLEAAHAATADLATHAVHGVPPGTILPFGGVADLDQPTGYIPCDGREVSRETYADLFEAVGTAWGPGDGVTTFNVPDLRGRFLRGQDEDIGRDPDVAQRAASYPGGNAGDAVGSVQSDEFKSHVHDGTGTHVHHWRGWRACESGSRNVRDRWYNEADPEEDVTMDDGAHNHGPKGGNETRPVNAYVKFIIKY